MTRAEIVFSGLIAACALTGLVLSSRILEGKGRFRRQMFVYYTFLSNAAIFLYFALRLLPGAVQTALLAPTVRFAAMLTILVTFLIYFFVISRFGVEAPELRPRNKKRLWGHIMVHYAVPLLALLEWLALADKSGLGLSSALWWLIAPVAYILFAIYYHSLGREIERLGRTWPYAFMDLEKIGMKQWLLRLLGVVLGFFLIGLLFVGVAALFNT